MAKWNKGEPTQPGEYLVCYLVNGVRCYSVGYFSVSRGTWVDKTGENFRAKIDAWCEFDHYRGGGEILP